MISPIALDVAHLFAGGLVLVSFMLLYQDRMTALINIFGSRKLCESSAAQGFEVRQIALFLPGRGSQMQVSVFRHYGHALDPGQRCYRS